MTTYVVGIKPPNEEWKKMKAIYDSCENGDVIVPDEVDDYFNNEPPDEKGVIVELKEEEWSDGDMSTGIEVSLDTVPKGVKIIRFINSY
jgi:hypothetical protein